MSGPEMVDPARADGEARFLASLQNQPGNIGGAARGGSGEHLDIKSQKQLTRLPLDIQAEVAHLLRRAAPAKGYANPESYSPASREMAITSLVNAVEARVACGLATRTLEELALPETVAAIESLIDVRWCPIRAAMIMADIRKLVRLQTQRMPALLNERQKALAAAPRRNIDHRVFHVSDYLRGARALAAIARVLEDANRVHGCTFRRDAAILALMASAHLRLGELHSLNVGHLKNRTLETGGEILTLSVMMNKVKGSRSVPIRDPDVIALLSTLRQGSPNTPLWRNSDQSRMSYGAVARVIARTGNLAVGEQAGARILRRAAMLDRNTPEWRRILLGHHEGSRTAERYYRSDESAEGKAAMERGSCQMAARVSARRSGGPLRRMQS